ncbi:MAG: hypothetical protein MUF04_10330, partial [Akkermansiaceae bacterium]|nr:hypothetical protein [Akkermansiaceae bacterium]
MKSIAALLSSFILAHAHTTLDLKVAHQTAPIGVDDATPRFSWRMESDRNGLAQTGYQILVATSEGKLSPGAADLWDSGRVESTVTTAAYAGAPLPSSAWLHWKVRTWAESGASEWSAPQSFLTGRIGGQPAQPFISFKDNTPFHKERAKLQLPPARYFRATFKPEKKIASAIAHATALGI